MVQVIALSGWKGSGKDTVAEYLVRAYNYKQLSFAARLKDVVASTYKVPREDLDNPAKKELPLTSYPAILTDPFSEKVHSMLSAELQSGFWTPRALCILEGSIKRSVHSNYWVQSVVDQILRDSIDSKFVISDMRYKSEVDTLSLMLPPVSLTTLRINRFDNVGTQDPSERNLDHHIFDMYIGNSGTKEELYAQVDYVIRQCNKLSRLFI